jgi:hypothetical protein
MTINEIAAIIQKKCPTLQKTPRDPAGHSWWEGKPIKSGSRCNRIVRAKAADDTKATANLRLAISNRLVKQKKLPASTQVDYTEFTEAQLVAWVENERRLFKKHFGW